MTLELIGCLQLSFLMVETGSLLELVQAIQSTGSASDQTLAQTFLEKNAEGGFSIIT